MPLQLVSVHSGLSCRRGYPSLRMAPAATLPWFAGGAPPISPSAPYGGSGPLGPPLSAHSRWGPRRSRQCCVRGTPGSAFVVAAQTDFVAAAVMGKRAVCLLSGGLDSSTALAWARREGFDCYALTFDYGQRHRIELEAAKRVARALSAKEHLILTLDLRKIGGSALTDDIAVPRGRSEAEIGSGIPVTYVPARNTIFLSYALALAEVREAENIVIGVNALDSSGYPDCRPEYIRAFEQLANLATKAGVEGKSHFRIHTPLIQISKADIVRKAIELGVDLSLTWSCYEPTPEGWSCGECDACLLRLKGFREAGVPDPLKYAR